MRFLVQKLSKNQKMKRPVHIKIKYVFYNITDTPNIKTYKILFFNPSRPYDSVCLFSLFQKNTIRRVPL